jgi:hypothetical protein
MDFKRLMRSSFVGTHLLPTLGRVAKYIPTLRLRARLPQRSREPRSLTSDLQLSTETVNNCLNVWITRVPVTSPVG